MKKHQDHRGEVVKVGGLEVFLGGAQYFPPMDLSGYDVVVPFLEDGHRMLPKILEPVMAEPITVLHYPIPDFQGVPEDWKAFLGLVTSHLHAKRRVVAFCMGGHGRTGTFLASLIALLEPKVRDPIAAARKRYCERAVETKKQADAIFALKGKSRPAKYDNLY